MYIDISEAVWHGDKYVLIGLILDFDPLVFRVPEEIMVCIYDSFDNNLGIEKDFTFKKLKRLCFE